MKLCKRLLCLLLSMALLLGLTTAPVWADDAAPISGSSSIVNPRYPDVGIPETPTDTAAAQSFSARQTRSAGYLSYRQAAEEMRDQMRDRSDCFTLSVYAPGYGSDYDSATTLVSNLLDYAISEELAVGVNSGDYLAWSWGTLSYEWEVNPYGEYFDITFYFTYYTTYTQEQEFLTMLAQVVTDLDLWKVSDYLKYRGIYQYVTDHVDYDYAGLATFDDDYTVGNTYIDPLGNDEWGIYSAYAALIEGEAVCQGYATLYYALCRSMGLPVRVITSIDHAWNIVELSGLWYSLDSTWDGQGYESYLDYFLKGSANFTDHPASPEYLTDAFMAAYPASAWDYEPVDSDYEPVCQFRDVAPTAYYYDAVQQMADLGLFSGVNNYTFRPNGTMTRAMLVTVLYRLAGSPATSTATPFEDVSPSAYYAEGVAWAYAMGITTGTSATHFGPSKLLTRQQLSTFLYRYAQTMGYDVSASDTLSSFSDTGSIDSYAVTPFAWAVASGIVNGVGNNQLKPKGSATRCQMAVMLSRFIAYYGL